MPAGKRREQDLIEKIRKLPEDKLAEVENFVDFLPQRQEERQLAQAVTGASEPAFGKVWDNRTTPSKTVFEFGDVVLVQVPFTDQSAAKQRPA